MLFRVEFPLDPENENKADADAMNAVGSLKAGLGAHRVSYSLGFAGGPAFVVVDVDSADALAQFKDLSFERDPEEAAAEAKAAADAASSANGQAAADSGKKSSKSEPQA